MSEEVATRAIDLFMFLADGAKTAEIIFTGGEPLLRFQCLRSIVNYVDQVAKEHAISYQLVLKTNGTITTSEIVDFLCDAPWRVVVSIDGSAESHDRNRRDSLGRPTWDVAVAALSALMQRGVECVASMTVHPNSCSTVLRDVRALQKLGVNRIDVGPVYGTVQWSEFQSQQFAESIGELALLMRDEFTNGGFLEIGPIYRDSEHVGNQMRNIWGCKAGLSNLAFLPDGSIAGCSALAMLTPGFPDLILGDVWKGLNDHAVTRLRRNAGATLHSRPQCKRCPTRNNCAGGCLAINYSTTRMPLHPPQFYCETIAAIPKAWKLAWSP